MAKSETSPNLAGFPVTIALPVQWGDQDAFGHVNNTVYFRWFESARIAYCKRLEFFRDSAETPLGPILASIQCNYRRQVTFPDTVQVGARVTRLGRSSLTMEYALLSGEQQAVAADGTSTLVVYDYATQQTQPIPDELRSAIERIEQREFPK